MNPIVYDDHLVTILQVPVVDRLLIVNVHKVYNFPILYPVLEKTFNIL